MSTIQYAGYVPGAIGRVVEMHAAYYHENWGFERFFEVKVARELAAFLDRFDDTRDGFWTASLNQVVQGAIAIDGNKAGSEGAHLRWFITSPALRGKGVGNTLVQNAVQFCRKCGYDRIYLWTFEGLSAARHLYEKFGFRLSDQNKGSQWGTPVAEQKFVLDLSLE